MFTLTIYFIALNVYVEFVLIYRPHPVYQNFKVKGWYDYYSGSTLTLYYSVGVSQNVTITA